MASQRLLPSLATIILLLLTPSLPGAGILFFVNTTSDTVVAGACANGTANCSLRGAIEAANSHIGYDGIDLSLPAGSVINLTQALPDITDNVDITGAGPANIKVANSNPLSLVFRIFNVTTAGSVTFSGMTITNGNAPAGESGGGIQSLSSGTVAVSNCVLNNNSSGPGNTFNTGGGAIANIGNGTLNVTNSVLKFNQGISNVGSGYGGGIYNKGSGTVNISNCTLNNNTSSYRGGGIYNENGIVTVTRSTFYNNGAAYDGGGIFVLQGTVNATNCTFYSNIAYHIFSTRGGVQGSGGGVRNVKGTLNLSNSTVTANFAGVGAGGVDNLSATGAITNVKSTIIAGNSSGGVDGFVQPDVVGTFTSQGFNLIGKKDGSTGFTAATDKKGTIASPLNPKLDQKGLRDNGGPTQTIALLTGSPAIDKGTSISLTGALTTDQRGFSRTIDNGSVTNANGGDGTDIGAFEFGAQ